MVSLFLLKLATVFAQQELSGTIVPRIRNYTKSEYGGGFENWKMFVHPSGIMLSANCEGLLLFDGTRWTKVKTAEPTCRYIDIDSDGTIWVCGDTYFGYLKVGASGELVMEDLTAMIPEDCRNFGYIWKIFALDGRVVIQTTWFIFLLKGAELKVLRSPAGFHGGIVFDNHFYVREKDKGIKRLDGDTLRLIPDGSRFADERVYAILPYSEGVSLWVTMKKGLFKYDGHRFSPWVRPNSEYFIKNTLTCAERLPDGNYVIGSGNEGLCVMSPDGEILIHLNKATGLKSNTVYHVDFNPNSGMLYASLQDGIASIELNSPFRILPVQDSWLTDISNLSSFGQRIIFGGNPTLYSISLGQKSLPLGKVSITPIDMTNTLSLQVIEAGDYLYNLSMTGAAYLDKDLISHPLFDCDCETNMFSPSVANPATGLVYINNSLRQITKKGKVWQVGGIILEIPGIVQLAENGSDWFILTKRNLQRISLNASGDCLLSKREYSQAEAPVTADTDVFRYKNQLFLVTAEGFYSYEKNQEQFSLFEPIDSLLRNRAEIFGRPFGFRIQGNKIWFLYKQKGGGCLIERNGTYAVEDHDFLKLQVFADRTELINPVDSNLILINLNKTGIVFYSTDVSNTASPEFFTLISKISLPKTGEVIFSGLDTRQSKSIRFIRTPALPVSLPYRKNSLQIEFGALWFEDNELTDYQYFLDGYTDDWSEWSALSKVTFSNLKEGTYTFHVRARNLYRTIGTEASFSFRITPPWYRTWWMITLLISTGLIGIFFLIRQFNKQLIQANIRLEKQVRLRTQELIHKRDELYRSELRLQEMEKTRVEQELKCRNEELHQKHQEITNLALLIANNNDFNNRFIDRIIHIYKSDLNNIRPRLAEVVTDMKREMSKEEHTMILRSHLEKVDPNFFYAIRRFAPTLTEKELQMVALIRSDLSIKEIASILNKSSKAVEMDRYRIRMKLGIKSNQNIHDFLRKLH